MRLEKSRILDCVPFDCGEGFCTVRDAGGVAEIDEAFVWEPFVQGAIDSQPADAAIEDPDW